MVEVIVEGIRQCCHTGQPVLLLKDKAGERFVPLRLPPEEAQVLAAELKGALTRESYVYTLLTSALGHLGGRIGAVVLHLAPDNVLQSCLRVDSRQGPRQVTAHPIDALAIAIRQRTPVFLNGDALEKVGFTARRDAEQPGGRGNRENDPANEQDGGGGADLPLALRDFLSSLDLSGLNEGG